MAQQRFVPTREQLWYFNLLPYQFGIVHEAQSKGGITTEEVVNTLGSWYDLMRRGLVHEQNGRLYATPVGKAFCTAIKLLQN